MAIPDGHAGLVLPRSGLARKHGITLVNTPGLIDAGYRGEVRVLLLNTDRSEPFGVQPGERIAQLVIVRHEAPALVESEDLGETVRGEGGFGSTGGPLSGSRSRRSPRHVRQNAGRAGPSAPQRFGLR